MTNPAFDLDFLPYSYTFVATSSSTPIIFTERDDDFYMNLDDVSVTSIAATPEPSQTPALGMGVLGLAGAILKARRRKAVIA